MTDTHELQQRVARIENEIWRLRWAALTLLAFSTIIFLSGFISQQNLDVVRAEKFIVVDGSGSELGALGHNNGLPFLMVGQARTGMVVVNRSEVIVHSGFPGESVSTAFLRAGSLSLSADNATQGVELHANRSGDGASLRLSQAGDLRTVLGTVRLISEDTGSTEIRAVGSLVVFDDEGQVLWKAP